MRVSLCSFQLLCYVITASFSGATGQLCSDEERNRNFNARNSSWTKNGFYDGSEMVTDSATGENVFVVKNRQAHWAGPIQILDKSCYSVGDTLLATVNILLKSASKSSPGQEEAYFCDPGKIWGANGEMDKVCPTLAILIKTGGVSKKIDLAKMVSPYYTGKFNTMYGELLVSQEMMDADTMALEFDRTQPKVNFYIESVSLTKSQNKCETLVKNGDGDVGDARAWTYYGTSGKIDVTQALPVIGTHSLWSRYRPDWNSGIQIHLDSDCLEQGSLYELSAKVHMKYGKDNVDCDHMLTDHTRTVGGERCPVANLAAINDGGNRQKRIVAAASKDWVKEEFNEIKGQFSFFTNELSAKELTIFFNMAPPHVDLILDDVTLTKIR